MKQEPLFDDPGMVSTDALLSELHYLGPSSRGALTYRDDFGVLVFSNPASRHLPQDRWFELGRWCIVGGHNAGSCQWAACVRWLRAERPDVTTVVSYSDPSVGHTGALYRACNWLWAPTWHRLRPPPTANGAWSVDGGAQAVKDRWIYPLVPDAERAQLLAVRDVALQRAMPWAEYREPKWKRGHAILRTGGGDYHRFILRAAEDGGPR